MKGILQYTILFSTVVTTGLGFFIESNFRENSRSTVKILKPLAAKKFFNLCNSLQNDVTVELILYALSIRQSIKLSL